ncbi:hypothetical protein ACEPAG_5382 [Sanghuangporus baumii]
MPIFDELHAFCAPDDAPEWTFELRPPTECYQWLQLCNRYNEENYEDEVVPLCPGKYFDDLFSKWNEVTRNSEVSPQLMLPNLREDEMFRLSNPRNAAVRRLNDDTFLTYAIELEMLAIYHRQIDFRHKPTYKNIKAIYHSAIQILYHVVEGKAVNYDPHYLIDLNKQEDKAREKLKAMRDPLKEDFMAMVYQYPSDLYQEDTTLTDEEQDNMFGFDNMESGEEESKATTQLPTPEDSNQVVPVIEVSKAM